MGSENSKSEREIQREAYIRRINDEKAIQEALEQQKQQRYNRLIHYPSTPSHTTPSYISYNSVAPPRSNSTNTTLYPNIHGTRFLETNIQPVQDHIQHPSVSNLKYQPSSVVPSAPAESAQSDDEELIQQTKNNGAIPKSRTNRRRKRNNNNQSLGCVTCSSSYDLHIYQCTNGHSSCQKCKNSHKHCGICHKPITDMRNITLEALVADMIIQKNDNQVKINDRIKCMNAKDGCYLSFPKEAMSDHLKECPYSDIVCPLSNIYDICKWKGKVNHLSDHFNDAHPDHIADVGNEMILLDIKAESIIIYLIKLGSFNFLFYMKRDQEGTLYMTSQLLGTKVSASKWTYEVQIYNKKELKRKFTYIDICNSFSIPVADIFNIGQCAIIEETYLSTFFKNNELTYQVFLEKKDFGKDQNIDNNI